MSEPWHGDARHAADVPDWRLAAAYRRCFAGAEGALVLWHLRQVTLDRALGPDVSDAALRHLEGQRALVRRIQTMAGGKAE